MRSSRVALLAWLKDLLAPGDTCSFPSFSLLLFFFSPPLPFHLHNVYQDLTSSPRTPAYLDTTITHHQRPFCEADTIGPTVARFLWRNTPQEEWDEGTNVTVPTLMHCSFGVHPEDDQTRVDDKSAAALRRSGVQCICIFYCVTRSCTAPRRRPLLHCCRWDLSLTLRQSECFAHLAIHLRAIEKVVARR